MKKQLLALLLVTVFSSCFAGTLTFNAPILDTSVLPDSYTSSLLHFENNLTDISSSVWTGSPAYGDGKFGQAIRQVMPAGSISYPLATVSSDKTAFNVGWNAFTVEFWLGLDIDMISYTTTQSLMGFVMQQGAQGHSLSVLLYIIEPENNRYLLALKAFSNGIYNISGSNGYTTDTDTVQWCHVCFERNSGATLAMYINGQLVASDYMAVNLSDLSDVWIGGQSTPAASSTIYIDEFSFSNGIAKYQGNFVPPAHAFGGLKTNKLTFMPGGKLSFIK
jgi:hypothetical protein